MLLRRLLALPLLLLMLLGTGVINAQERTSPARGVLVAYESGYRISQEAIRGATAVTNELFLYPVPRGLENQEARRLQKQPGVRYAVPNYVRHWTQQATSTRRVANGHESINALTYQIQADLAHAAGILGSFDVTVAVVDSGIDGSHPDLRNVLVPGINFFDRSQVDTSDKADHGTSVAGALHHAVPRVSIRPIVVGDWAGPTDALLIMGIRYAADRPDQVINLSVSGPENSQAVCEAIAYAQSQGKLIVAAGSNIPGQPAGYPGQCNDDVLRVSATNYNDVRVSSSLNVHIAAPGQDLYLPVSGGGYDVRSGTSFATSQVSGAAALVKSRHPDYTAAQIGQTLRTSGDNISIAPQSAGQDHEPRLNVAAAVGLATRPVIVGLQPTSPLIEKEGGQVQVCVTARRAGSVYLNVTLPFELTGGGGGVEPIQMTTRSLNRYCGSYTLSPNTRGLLTYWFSAYAKNAVGETFTFNEPVLQEGPLRYRSFVPFAERPPTDPTPVPTGTPSSNTR